MGTGNPHPWARARVLAGVGAGRRKKPQGGPCYSLVMSGGCESGVGAKYEGGDTEESGLELVSGGDKGSMVGGALKSNDRQEVWRRTKEFVLGDEIEEGGGVSVHYRSPGVVGLVADNVILMWVAAR